MTNHVQRSTYINQHSPNTSVNQRRFIAVLLFTGDKDDMEYDSSALNSNCSRSIWNLGFRALCNLILYTQTERRPYGGSVYLCRRLRKQARTCTRWFYSPSGPSGRRCCDEGTLRLLESAGPTGWRLSLWRPRRYRPRTDWRFLLRQHWNTERKDGNR